MGKVEKIAVLSVLFLIAVILVVSMTTDKPVDTAHAAVLGEKSNTVGELQSPAAPDASNKLLSSEVRTDKPEAASVPAPAPVAVQPLTIPTGSLLKSTEGLSAGYDSQRLMYAWQSGDSYVTVAKKLYGDPAKFSLLQNANEGRENIASGEKILVPIYDAESNVVASDEPAPAAKKNATTTKKKAATEGAKSTPVSAAGHTHTVIKGDSLWLIAKAELGNGSRWKEIFELNKDKLKSPESLRDGMQLKLP